MVGISLDKLVLDTNIILSLLFSENYEFFVHLKYKHNVQLLTCPQQIAELKQTLDYPRVAKLLNSSSNNLVEFFTNNAVVLEVDERFDRVADTKDNYLIDLAYTAKCFYIASGDREVLALKHIGRIQIISFTHLRKLLSLR